MIFFCLVELFAHIKHFRFYIKSLSWQLICDVISSELYLIISENNSEDTLHINCPDDGLM